MQVLLGEPSFSSKARIMNMTATFELLEAHPVPRANVIAGMRKFRGSFLGQFSWPIFSVNFLGDCLRGRD
jgi:hypothetical protein